MNYEEKAGCSCSCDCDCGSSTYSRTSSAAHDMASLNNSGKEETGQTDVEDNQQSEGETRKRSNSGSPARTKKILSTETGNGKTTKIHPATQSLSRKHANVSVAIKINEPVFEREGRGCLSEPQGLHVLQPHSHKRHYRHHLRDQIAINPALRHHQHHDRHHHRRHREIVPTLESCEYKDTNFSTQGSPPRTRTYRKHLSSRGRKVRKEESKGLKTESQRRHRTKCHVAASFWKEPSDPRMNENLPHSSQELENENGSGKIVVNLNKYKNESVAGPQARPSNGKSKIFPLSKRAVVTTEDEDENKGPTFAKAYTKSWETQKSCRGQHSASGKLANKRRDFSSKTFSSLAKGTKIRDQDKENSSIFSACIPSVSALRSRSTNKSQAKKPICQSCIDRRFDRKDVSIQTEVEQIELQSAQESQTEQKAAAEAVIKPAVADLSLYAGPPPYLESSESNSISTEDSSSLTFDDDDMVNFGSSERSSEKCSRNDILSRISQVQSDMEQLRCDTACSVTEDGVSSDETGFTKNLLEDLTEIVSEIYELYDDFDTDEKDEQSEFNELKKQLQQYKRTCRVLEYELMSADAKSVENTQTSELQEEIKLCRQVAVSLHWELQSADEKLKMMIRENDQFRQKLAASEIQRTVLEKEVISLRNSVDQMSLHASSVPANEGEAIKSRDTVPELNRQIHFQNEERKAILAKLVEIDKEKNRLENQLQLYLSKYGEIGVSDRAITEDEVRSNETKIRIRMVEDQAGMLGRRVMQLQLENENLNKQLGEKVKVITPNLSRKASSSDLQFLEDEVEALKMTLEEVEEENSNLRFELKQSKDQSVQNDKRLQIIQTTQTSLRGLITPTASDKIAAWEVSDHSSARSPTLRSESDFTVSGNEFAPVLTAIDEATQTYDSALPEKEPVEARQIQAAKTGAGLELSEEFMEILKRTDDIDVDFLVSQLTNLAIATRHLVDESPSSTQSINEILKDTTSSNLATPSTDAEHQLMLPIREQNPLESEDEKRPLESSESKHGFTKFHFLVFSILVYIIVTSLDITSLSKFVLLTVFFFMI